jgi:hypothetical protein
MSNKPVQFKRKKLGKKAPIPMEIGDELFLFASRLGTKALEPIGRLQEDEITAMFQAIDAMLVERPVADELPDATDPIREPAGSSYKRFVDLDLDLEEELPDVFKLILGLYGLTPGESEASSTFSDDDEANSTPTSDASTRPTSIRSKRTSTPKTA